MPISYSKYNVRGSISAKHQLFYPAVISVIIISANLQSSNYVISLKNCHAMASEGESFTIDSMIRVCHFYKDVLSDKCCTFAVAMCKGKTVVRHMPRKISAICYAFLGKTGATITGSYRIKICEPATSHIIRTN